MACLTDGGIYLSKPYTVAIPIQSFRSDTAILRGKAYISKALAVLSFLISPREPCCCIHTVDER